MIYYIGMDHLLIDSMPTLLTDKVKILFKIYRTKTRQLPSGTIHFLDTQHTNGYMVPNTMSLDYLFEVAKEETLRNS
jgi:hypothetical protein